MHTHVSQSAGHARVGPSTPTKLEGKHSATGVKWA